MKTDTMEPHVEEQTSPVRNESSQKSNGQKIDSLQKILSTLVGHMITVVDPQTYAPTLTGYEIEPTAYKAKVVSCEHGILRLLMEYMSDPRSKTKERAQLFVPVEQIKRVMVAKSQKLISL